MSLDRDVHQTYWDLYRAPEKLKPRKCLKCGKIRKSTKGVRQCSECTAVNSRAPARANEHNLANDVYFGGAM